MRATKQELIRFLEDRVLSPVERNTRSNKTILRKVRLTRMRLNECASAEIVERYFWNAMATDNGIDTYEQISRIGAPTFEAVRAEFKRLCGR